MIRSAWNTPRLFALTKGNRAMGGRNTQYVAETGHVVKSAFVWLSDGEGRKYAWPTDTQTAEGMGFLGGSGAPS